MSMHRFFTQDKLVEGRTISVEGQDALHMRRSLRLQSGEHVLLCDGRGLEAAARIARIADDGAHLDVLEVRRSRSEPPVRVCLYQSLPKGGKMDEIVQKCVELGVSRIVPVETSRSVSRIGGAAGEKRERWQRIARQAAQQSQRGIVPEVADALPFGQALARCRHERILLPWECEDALALPKALDGERALDIGLWIGAEGGFSLTEVEALREIGALSVTMGPRILRCETAGMAALAVIMALCGAMEGSGACARD